MVNDNYDKTVTVQAKYKKKKWESGEHQEFTLEIPLSDLNVDKPTSMDVSLYAYVNGEYMHINIDFIISW